MLIKPENSKCFQTWKDPVSGVISYILIKRAAPLQQSFYFVNRSMTTDGKKLWFYCAFPPGGDANFGRSLAVLDFEGDSVHHFPETLFLDASPMVDPISGEVFWCNKTDIWKRGPDPRDCPQRVARIPDSIRKGTILRIATHLTISSDKKELGIDAEIGNSSYIGSVNIKTGQFSLWQKFDRCYNHAQFHPRDPDLMLLAQDYWFGKATGKRHTIERDKEGKLRRIWLIRRGQTARPVKPKWKSATHEWWSADGQYIYYIDGEKGTVQINWQTGEKILVNPFGRWHGHASMDNQYFVADNIVGRFYRGCAANVVFYNRSTGKKVDIVTKAPALTTAKNPSVYHIDPHPQFVCNDHYIAYTTSVLGRIDVALVKTKDLIAVTT